MTYMKLITEGAKKHLAFDQLGDEVTTLCGCTITRPQSWKRVNALEGDECERCAGRAFEAIHPR